MWFITQIALAILASYIAYESQIIQDIKYILGLNPEADYSQYKWKSWALPFVWAFLEFRALINCPYCIGWWLGFFTNILFFSFEFWQSFLLAPIVILFVHLYQKITLV